MEAWVWPLPGFKGKRGLGFPLMMEKRHWLSPIVRRKWKGRLGLLPTVEGIRGLGRLPARETRSGLEPLLEWETRRGLGPSST